MGRRAIVAGASAVLGEALVRLFELDGYTAEWVDTTGTADVPDGPFDLCVAFWPSRETCPVEFLRRFRVRHPRAALLCCSSSPDPLPHSFLLAAGVAPDAVLRGPMSEERVLAEARNLLALRPAEDHEYLVLCVDDDPAFLLSLERLLPDRVSDRVAFGLRFEFFQDPLDAADFLSEDDPARPAVAMVIADQVMPGMPGVELLALAGRRCPGAVRVMLTGQAGLEDVVEAVNRRDLDHYATKPIENIHAFTHTLAHLLREYHLAATGRLESERVLQEHEFIRELVGRRTLDETLRTVVEFAAALMAADSAALMLRDGDRLVVRTARGLPRGALASSAIPADSGLAADVFAGGVPVAVPASDDPAPEGLAVPRPFLAAPLLAAGRPLGLLLVAGRRTARPPGRGEMIHLSNIAGAAAIAVARHFERDAKERAHFDVIRSLSLALEAKDPYAHGHSLRVAHLAVQLARKLGLGPDEIEAIERAAVIHDIGKLGVPEHILNKRDTLSYEEYAQVTRHPELGERIVAQLAFMADSLPILRGHHERWDGRGYPDRLKGERIPLGARIVAVADVYDALTSDRPYRPRLSREAALQQLRAGAGTRYDPACVRAFLEIVAGDPGQAAEAPAEKRTPAPELAPA